MPLLAIPAGVILCAAATRAVRRWALGRGFVDRPGGHKAHAAPVALGGGVAVTAAVIVPILAGLLAARLLVGQSADWMPAALAPHLRGIVAKSAPALAICAAAAAMCLLGLLDDRRPLPVVLKLLVQVAIAAVLVIGLRLRLLSHLAPVVSIVLSMLWIVLLTNAMNFLDNMDGLSAGVAAIAAALFAVTAARGGQIFVPTCCWLLFGALIGFLPFNFHPARIFLGDAGSTVIGLLLAVFTILTTFANPQQGGKPLGVIAPLIVMAVPLYDTCSVFLLRLRDHVPIWTGDRRHFSHRLVRRGMTVPQAVLVIWLATLVTGLPALLLPNVSWDDPAAWIIGLQTILVVLLVGLLESAKPHGSS